MLTGSAGQVGHEVARLTPGAFDLKALTSAELDITDAAAVEAAVKACRPDIIINAAAYTAVDKAEQEPERAFDVNQTGPANLGRAARDADAAVIHISTDYVFTGDQTRAYRETDPCAPTGVYGASKLAGEHALTGSLTQSLVLRTSWVFGATGNNFVKTMIRLGNEREELRVVADQYGCPTSAAAIANCLWQLAESYRMKGDLRWGTYHFAGAPSCSWHAFAEVVLDCAYQTGLIKKRPPVHPITTRDYPTPARRPAFSELDCALILQTFGIEQPDWRKDLNAMLRELQQ